MNFLTMMAAAGATSGSSQTSPYWISTIGGTQSDNAVGLSLDPSGNPVIAGYTSGAAFGNGLNYIVAKFDTSGNMVWTSERAASNYVRVLNAVAVDSVGNIYAGGNEETNYWGNIFKFNSAGTVQWGYALPTGSNHAIYDVALDATGNPIFSGYYTGVGYGQHEAVLMKYDTNGTRVWQVALGGTGIDLAPGTHVDSSGNVYMAGQSTTSSQGGYDAFVAKFDSAGSLLWQQHYGGAAGDDAFTDVVTDSSLNVYVTGVRSIAAGNAEVVVAKFNSSGVLQWQRQIGGASNDGGSDIAVDSSGNIYVVGNTTSVAPAGANIFICKYDTNGTLIWQRILGGGGADRAYAVRVNSSGDLYIAGSTTSQGVGSDDILLVKLPSDGSLIGTYGNFTYAAGSLSDAAGGLTVTSRTLSVTPFNQAMISSLASTTSSTLTTSKFAVSQQTSTDTYSSNTVLLLKGNGTNGETEITDSSLSSKAITTFGNTQISTAQSKFGGASLKFDGAGDYLTTADSADFKFTAGTDFTIETWFYIAANSDLNANNQRNAALFVKNVSSGTIVDSYGLTVVGDATTTGTGISFSNTAAGIGSSISATTTIAQNIWHHVAVCRVGSTTSIYLNGISIASGTLTAQDITGGANPLMIGSGPYTGYLNHLNGYMDDIRITKGIARYTANFTPPTVELPTPTSSDPYWAQTQFLARFDGTNGSTSHVDSSQYARTITTTGSAAVTTVSPLVGTGSLELGTGKYVSATIPAINLASTPFTIEWSMFITDNTINLAPFTISGASLTLYVAQKYSGVFYVGDGVAVNNIGQTWDLVANTTYHMAFSFDGTTYRVYQNGVLKYSTTTKLSSGTVTNLVIGARPALGIYFAGRIDEFRVTVNQARYTGSSYTLSLPFPNN